MNEKCIQLTKKGNRCKNNKLKNNNYCRRHYLYNLENHSRQLHSKDYLYQYPTEIVPHLFLGSETKVCNMNWLKSNNIKTVVNATNDLMCKYDKTINFYMWNLEDIPSQNIIPYLEKTSVIIDNCLRKGESILVHCHMGISRSATLVWYWLSTRKYDNDIDAALLFLESKRWIVNPNKGFIRQVKEKIRKNKK